MDCNIIHGGLGTTAEAMRAGKPIIVTGILLMDQRFWAHQVAELGVSPGSCHISDFDKHCVDWVDDALNPDKGWTSRFVFSNLHEVWVAGGWLGVGWMQKALGACRLIAEVFELRA